MAVGAVSSQQTLQNAPAIIRAGEKIATTAAALKDPKARAFRHVIPGAKFIMPDGLELQFLGGTFVTADPEIIRELNAVADKPASMIFTHTEVATAIAGQQNQLAADAADTAGKTPE